jgi:hypothetical protein
MSREDGSATQLAALRIVVPAMILTTQEVRHGTLFAAMPPGLRAAPEGLVWFAAHVPIGPGLATVAQALTAFSAMTAIVGIRARLSLFVLSLGTFYLFAVSQLSGAVWHDMHLVWMTALLTASPCDEALAYDRKDASLPSPSPRFGLPLDIARLLLACVYFFPGLHKLLTSGLAWALSDNLRNQLWWKWAQHGVIPTLRVDHAPWLLHASGLFVLLFELTFPLFALRRRLRPWAAALGLVFHGCATYFFRIPFVSLWALYVVLVDPSPLIERIRSLSGYPVERATRTMTGAASLLATWFVGAALVFGAFVQGARGQMKSFPFACYPTFEWMVGPQMPDLLLAAVGNDGRETPIVHARDVHGYRTQREWGEVWSLAGVTTPVDALRLETYLASISAESRTRALLAQSSQVRAYRAELSVVPEERGRPPVSRTLLAVLPVPAPPPPSRSLAL